MLSFLLAFAMQMTGYPPPAQIPRIDIHEQAWFERDCPRAHCSARMATIGNVIAVSSDQDMDRPATQALLVHELVHVLQNHAYGPATDCVERTRREREAIMAQVLYLNRWKTTAHVNIAQVLKQYRCGDGG